jgi:Protein of unknown function (DUF1656)
MISDMSGIPSEFALGGVYFPPLFFVVLLAIVFALLTAHFLNKYRLSRYFFFPPAVFLSLVVIYSGFISYTGLFGDLYAG